MDLNSICELIVDCEHKTAPTQETGYPSIRTPNIGRGRFILEGVNRVSEETYRLWTRRAVPRPGDLIMAREAPVGNVAIIPPGLEPCLGQRTLLIRPDRSQVEPSFLNYFLNGPHGQGLIHAKTNGATVSHLNMKDVREMELPEFPPIPVQKRIADILSAYDELIENSQRRIKILESMACSLYREWFVHFRFPGHENHPRVSSPLGEIPQGWEVKKLGDAATITMGLSPKGDTYNEDGIGTPLVNGPVEFGGRFAKQLKWTTAPSKLCKEGDLIVCVRGSTTGKHVKSDGVYCLGRGVCSISSKYQGFFDQLFENELPVLLGQTSGSTFPSWTGPQLNAHPILFPSNEVLSCFDTLVKPMTAAILMYSRKIENLRRTRDLLLPRLLSGQINLEAAQVDVEAA